MVTTAQNIMRRAGGEVTRVEVEAGVEVGAEGGGVGVAGVGVAAGVEGAEEEGAEAGAEAVAGGGAAEEAGAEVEESGGVDDTIPTAGTQIATTIKTFAFMLSILWVYRKENLELAGNVILSFNEDLSFVFGKHYGDTSCCQKVMASIVHFSE